MTTPKKDIQIVPCPIGGGEWEITNRSAVFAVKNSQAIDKLFEQLFSEVMAPEN